ncbi:MAG: hypothetical protein RDV48_23105 [Candidatus Eremiobacteraeota bacterium]|nr:hypothetical protein [Candidatus Eremiobacteraeota bacterium]
MTIGTVAQPLTAGQMLQECAPGAPSEVKDQSSDIQDSAQVSLEAKPEKSETLEKLKNWIKDKVNSQNKELTTADKVKRVAFSTAVGAASGAAMIATGTAPLVSAIVSSAVGAVAFGGLGLFVGFIGGMIAEKAGKKGAMGTGSMMGVIGGGIAGAGIGGVCGWAQGHLLIAAANACGGGPVGGAIAGAIFSGVSATLSILRRSGQHKPEHAPANNAPTPQQPAPAREQDTKPAQA